MCNNCIALDQSLSSIVGRLLKNIYQTGILSNSKFETVLCVWRWYKVLKSRPSTCSIYHLKIENKMISYYIISFYHLWNYFTKYIPIIMIMSIVLNYFFLSNYRRKENNPKSIYPRSVDSQYSIVFIRENIWQCEWAKEGRM